MKEGAISFTEEVSCREMNATVESDLSRSACLNSKVQSRVPAPYSVPNAPPKFPQPPHVAFTTPTTLGLNMTPAQNWLHTKMQMPTPMKKRTAIRPPLQSKYNTGNCEPTEQVVFLYCFAISAFQAIHQLKHDVFTPT